MINDEYKRNDTIEDETRILSVDEIAQADPVAKKPSKGHLGFFIPSIVLNVINALMMLYILEMFSMIEKNIESGDAAEVILGGFFGIILFLIGEVAVFVLASITMGLSIACIVKTCKRKINPAGGIVNLVIGAIYFIAVIILFILLRS